MRHSWNIRIRLLAGLVALGLTQAGCLETATQPTARVQDPSESLPPTGYHWAQAPTAGSAGILGNQRNAPSGTFAVTAADGGKFTFDRYTLDIPKGALRQDATITIVATSQLFVECDLQIDPPSANGFLKPVQLSMDCRNTNVTPNNAAGLTIYWRSPAGWVNLHGKGDPQSLKVTADLQHFSCYRSGW